MRRRIPGLPRTALRWATLVAGSGLAACLDFGPPGEPDQHDGVTGIYFNGPSFTLVPGQAKRLSVEGTTNLGWFVQLQDVKWSSLDTSIATVNARGAVRAVAIGDARIRATSQGVSGIRWVPVRKSICSGTSSEGRLEPGMEVSGTIGIRDCGMPDGWTADGWELEFAETTTFVAEVTSGWPHFITQLVTDLQMNEVGSDTSWHPPFYSGGYPGGARMARTVPAGKYRLWVQESFGSGDDYSLRLSTAQACAPAMTTPFPLGTTLDTDLGTTECALPDGGRADGWSVTGDGGYVAVSVRNASELPFLSMHTASMTELEPVFFGVYDSATVERVYQLPAASTRYFWTRWLDTLQQTGTYSIKARRAPLCLNNEATPLTLGVEVADSVVLDDCLTNFFGTIHPSDLWTFTIAATAVVQVDLTVTGEIPGWQYYGVDVKNTVNGTDMLGTITVPAPGVRRMQMTFPAGTYRATVSTQSGMLPYALVVRLAP